MKVLIVGDPARYEKFNPHLPCRDQVQCIFCPRGSDNAALLSAGADAQALLLDAISPADAALIAAMPNLKLIHSEGVAYNKIDLEAARARGIYVCNNPGFNAAAVAEQSVMLMLCLLRRAVAGHAAVIAGEQIVFKETNMAAGIHELGSMTVGLVGFGNIARATARLLRAFGCRVYYYNRTRRSPEEEAEYAVEWLPLEELCAACDIVSLHLAVTAETAGLVDRDFLARMKPTALLINTARGDLVDNLALREALINGAIAGAGLDTIHPEPNTPDNPLIDLPPQVRDKVVYSPHIGGVTIEFFLRAHRHMWTNVGRLLAGERPDCVVNGV